MHDVPLEIPAWEPLSDEVLRDQRAHYDEHRRGCPVARSPRGVTVFRHADVVAVANDPVTFSSAASAFRSVPNTLDPPEHGRFRAVVDRFFTPERMAALEPVVRRIAREVVVDAGPRTDAVTGLGYRYAVRAQAAWLGWEGAEERLLSWMAANHAATRSGDRERTAPVAAEFDRIVGDQVQRRRELGEDAPDDPTTELTRVTVEKADGGGEPLSDADTVSILRNWTAGDLGSIAASLGVVAHFLATHPDIQEGLRQDPTGLAGAIDEMLRIDDPFLVNRRVATAATEVEGYPITAGERLYLNWTSANRDETVFGDPDAYRPLENAEHNLVYGTGIHVCPGRPLATMELVVMTEELLAATTRIELAEDEVPVRETYPVGGWARVPVLLRV
ncbi:MAG: cytochrome P450 [Dermatophilaceae bacterium]